MSKEPRVGAGGMVERYRRRGQLLVAVGFAARRTGVIADHLEHGLAVRLIAWEGPKLARHLRARRIGDAGHDGGEGAAERAALVGVVWNARRHQQAADIGVA